MKTVKVLNVSKEQLLLDKAFVANTFLMRLRGLLGRTELPLGEGLIISPCNAVHTIGMRFSIDVAFVDRENHICHIISGMPPNRVGKTVKMAWYVVEGPDGQFSAKDTVVGDLVELIEL